MIYSRSNAVRCLLDAFLFFSRLLLSIRERASAVRNSVWFSSFLLVLIIKRNDQMYKRIRCIMIHSHAFETETESDSIRKISIVDIQIFSMF
jgi:hypothetical protein